MSEQNNSEDQGAENEFERIKPAAINVGTRRPDGRQPGRGKSNFPAAFVAVALALLLVLVGAVFLWLPSHTSKQQIAAQVPQTPPESQVSAEPADAQATKEAAPSADTLLDQRQRAQSLAEELTSKRERLMAKAVERWAAQPFAENTTLAEQVKTKFEQREYADSIKTAERAINQAGELLAQADRVLKEALARGEQAFANKDSAKAIKAFELALAVAPDNAAAKKGLRRAHSLDDVLAKMRSGQAREQSGELTQARADYQQALKLDGEYTPAREALQRVQSTLSTRAFNSEMSRGLAALERGNFTQAQSAFQAAAKLRPGDSDAADGIAQASAGLQQQAIAGHRERATTQAEQENWRQALDAYDAALKLDSTLGFAQAGKAKASERLALDNKLQYQLDNPGRLSDAAVRSEAKALLSEARAVDGAGSKLQRQVTGLDQLVTTMSQPVSVQLQSDNRTEVLVYHVGKLGAFDSKTLQLTPGSYTVVGRCAGYRDVRRTIEVKPKQSQKEAKVGPISIRCEEKI